MKEVIAMRAVQVTDDDIAFCISAVCTKLLGRPVKCRTYCDVSEYWGAIAEGDKFTVKELLDLLVAVNADAETCRETIPLEDPETASLGMDLSRGLLKLALAQGYLILPIIAEPRPLQVTPVKHAFFPLALLPACPWI